MRFDESGFRQHHFKLIKTVLAEIDGLKRIRQLKSRDVIVNALIGEAARRFQPHEIPLPPPPVDETEQLLPLSIHDDRFAFVAAVQHYHRGIPLGVALEAIVKAATRHHAPVTGFIAGSTEEHSMTT